LPGLTGLWQVSGKNKTTFVEMIQLDIRYAKNKTFWWDLKIILMTVPVLVFQMLEARWVRKASQRPMQPKPNYSQHAANPYAFTKAPLIGAVHAAGQGDESWVRKESKLNL
jgi:hypothetical protein